MSTHKVYNKDRHHFLVQRQTAGRRGIEFNLTYAEWLDFWMASGHFHERGRKRDQYCMARFGDVGPYELGNIKIVLVQDNQSEAHLGKPKIYTPEGKVRLLEAAHRPRGPLAPEHAARLAHISRTRIRTPLSAEHKAKISATKRAQKAHKL